MSEEVNDPNRLPLRIPIIKAETESQTIGHLVNLSPDDRKLPTMDSAQMQSSNLRKRRNLSKNRAQATRQREKTPEPGRTLVPHEDTTTSDDEDPQLSPREQEADKTYNEMKRLVQEQSGHKDPVYDLNTDEVLEARSRAANDRRRRSVSPFALPDKEKDDDTKLQRRGSFVDPSNKFLSTTYTLSPKDESSSRRCSLTIDDIYTNARRHSLTPPISSSPKDKSDFQYPKPSTPKRLEAMVYPDEPQSSDDTSKTKPVIPAKREDVFKFNQSEKAKTPRPSTPKPDTPVPTTGEIITKVIQVERTPSRKLSAENKPVVEIRQRVVRTPSRKSLADSKPVVTKQIQNKEETAGRVPPVKPARSHSASRFVDKTSESEMSEDQANQHSLNSMVAPKRRVVPTPRRFMKNKTGRAARSQSVNRVEDIRVQDKTGTGMSQTSQEIINLMELARARSLSISKDDARVPNVYRDHNRTLYTPNKTPSTPKRSTRGISCPKTIQIISDKEILSGIVAKKDKPVEKLSKQSSGYIDASQSEYTSSCYSTSPSDNEYNFDLSEKTAELTRKLHLLSQEANEREDMSNILLAKDVNYRQSVVDSTEPSNQLRKRNVSVQKTSILPSKDEIKEPQVEIKKSLSRWTLIANWQQFKIENHKQYELLIIQRDKCISEFILMIIMCGLGGMMFKMLESTFENNFKCITRNVKRDFIESLWRGSHYLREEDWKSMARKKLYEFENQLHTAHEAGVTSYSGQKSWNFMNAFVYCMTLISTIGYGHITPKTTYGRVATIVYAIIGIPLFLIVLADFGKLFTRIIKFFWSFIRRFYYTRSCKKVRKTVPVMEVMKGLNIVYDVVRRPSQMFSEEDMSAVRDELQPPPLQRKPSDAPPPLPPKPNIIIETDNETEPQTPVPSVFEIDDEFNLPISLAIIILIIYIFIGAVVFHWFEEWNFFESFYFVFISMSTIGLGDMVPDNPMHMMASILYLVFGLALTSMCINVVQVKLSDTFKKASNKLGATIGLKVAEEDGSLVPITPPPVEVAPIHFPKKQTVNDEDPKDR